MTADPASDPYDMDNPMKQLPSYTAGVTDWSLISTHMIGAMRRYIEHGLEPGDFLTAVLRNDLKEACLRADNINIGRLADYIRFLYYYVPGGCWGSPEKYERWIEQGGFSGHRDYDPDMNPIDDAEFGMKP